MEAGLRAPMEALFGTSLESVRLHDSEAGRRVAKSHRANAVTIGNDIYFSQGRFQPHHSAGRQLLAHEITHSLQQHSDTPGSSVDDAESEAESAGKRALTPSRLPPVRHSARTGRPMRDAASLKTAMEDELDDFFVGIDNIWPQIRREPQSERDIVRNDPALERTARSEIGDPSDLLKTYLLLRFQKEANFPAHFKGLIDATDRWGTQEARIFSILRSVTPDERLQMRNTPGVAELLEDEMSGSELTTARNLLAGQIEHMGTDDSPARNSTHLEISERFDLSVNARESFDSVVEKMDAATSETSRDVLLADTSLWSKIVDEFNLQETWYLRMIARYRGRDHFPKLTGPNMPAQSFLFPIWDAVEGAGTDEDKLIDTLNTARRSTGMTGGRRLRAVDELKDDPFFIPMVEDEMGGDDLKRALTAVSGSASTTAAARGQLEDAIDDHDMARIRRILRDVNLSLADRQRLQVDPVILDEMGEELSGWKLCETSLLLEYGPTPFPFDVTTLLARFQRDPVDVAGAITFLTGLAGTAGALRSLRDEPGIYFMLTNSGLSQDNRRNVIAALRADQPAYQEPGSAGTLRHHVESVSARLPIHFTSSQIRVVLRCNIDPSRSSGNKFDTDLIEDWIRTFDDVWNSKFVLTSGGASFDLVFALLMELGVSSPDITIFVMNWKGRSFVRSARREMHLFTDDLEPKTVAHEFGHILGNPDEYDLTASEYTRITGTAAPRPFPREGKTAEGLMGSQHESTYVHTRFALPALDVINSVRDVSRFPDPFAIRRK